MTVRPEGKSRILVVDDEPQVCEVISRWLESEGYSCATAISGERAMEMLQSEPFDLVISDIMMPGMSGIDLLTFVKSMLPDTAVVMVTAVHDRDTAIMSFELGAYGYIFKPFDFKDVLFNVANALERRRLMLQVLRHEQDLQEKLEQTTVSLNLWEDEIILRLLNALSCRGGESPAHARRVGHHASLLARYLRWEYGPVYHIGQAAQLHDLGKIGISDAILHKRDKLTAEEAQEMKKHPELGAKILEGSRSPMLRMACDIARAHHEKWDGSGYPRRLSKDRIPESARIVAIVDTYDELTHDQPRRPALSQEKAVTVMRAYRQEWFDPRIFDYFVTLLPSIRSAAEKLDEEPEPHCQE
ncbi:MAG: HD domain-containing phosphohydrolase [Pseudomonadota bacterium]